jgi:glycosyltransferase involved in cell wall biosynthesis
MGVRQRLCNEKKNRVLLFGPKTDERASWGGGRGGYTRKMELYLRHFESEAFELVPCYHSVRTGRWIDNLVFRMVRDIWNFCQKVFSAKPVAVHVLGQYRGATPREFAVVLLARLMSIRVVYEMKGGAFHDWYPRANIFYRRMIRFCLEYSDSVLCQGAPFLHFIREEFGIHGVYYPNFVHESEIPREVSRRLRNRTMRILFVGFAYEGKGVFELVQGCELASRVVRIDLTLVGEEHPEFTTWIDERLFNGNLRVVRHGSLPHEDILALYSENDIYLYPTRHGGEGHNNTINEAMMNGMVIATTQHGFNEEVLMPDCAYFISAVGADEIARTLLQIDLQRDVAVTKGKRARKRLVSQFSSRRAFGTLVQVYRNLGEEGSKGA